MILLPIVVRELRVAARRKSVYRARFWTAFTTIGIGAWIILASGLTMGRTQGAMVFSTLAALCFLSCLSLAGNTADCISEEKREGTLGFLFLTDLKGHDIALGKLFSASLLSFYSILGTFPIVAVSLLLGGVSAVEFWEVALALLNVFFFSHTLGLFMSVLNAKRNSATMGTAALLLIYTAGFYALSSLLTVTRFRNWAPLFECLNPAYSVFWACTAGASPMASMGRHFGHYWASLLLIHLNAWLFLVMASARLPHCWQEKAVKKNMRWSEKFVRDYHERHTPRAQLLDANPFLWLSVRNRLGSIKIWIALAVNSGFWLWILSRGKFSDYALPVSCTIIALNHLVLKIGATGDVTNNLEEKRHSGGLELLLSCTPISVVEIIKGQWLALRRHFLWPTVAVLIADLALMTTVCAKRIDEFDAKDKAAFFLTGVAAMVMLVVDLYAIGWVGMWNAMSQKKLRHAAGATISQILVLPWVIFFFISVFCALCHITIIDSVGSAVTFWFLIGVGVDMVAVNLFRDRLINEFRALSAVQGGERLGLFGRLGRFLGTVMRHKPE